MSILKLHYIWRIMYNWELIALVLLRRMDKLLVSIYTHLSLHLLSLMTSPYSQIIYIYYNGIH